MHFQGSIAKLIRENVHKLRVTHLLAAAQAVRSTWVTHCHMTYLDGSSDGFRELLPDMFKWNPGSLFMTESA